jgi:hypothetical protein
MISDLEFEVSSFVNSFVDKCKSHKCKSTDIKISHVWSDGIPCNGIVLYHRARSGFIFEESYANCYSKGEVAQALRYANEQLEELKNV